MATHTFDAADVALEGWLSGFLHDAICTWDEDAFDKAHGTFSLKLRRRYYEEPRHRRSRCLLFLAQVTDYRMVPAVLIVRNVWCASFGLPRISRKGSGSRLDYAEIRGLELYFYFGDSDDITLSLTELSPVTVVDTGPPSPEFEDFWWGHSPESMEAADAEFWKRRSDG